MNNSISKSLSSGFERIGRLQSNLKLVTGIQNELVTQIVHRVESRNGLMTWMLVCCQQY